ncbi:hypothetical protein V1478_011415 [Vespula squamosa]|uniref:Uncharacterized protein n=1 Tax=Vespula squamosa TaxID=30214 RepID=A0ABD2AEF3_VESSQ
MKLIEATFQEISNKSKKKSIDEKYSHMKPRGLCCVNLTQNVPGQIVQYQKIVFRSGNSKVKHVGRCCFPRWLCLCIQERPLFVNSVTIHSRYLTSATNLFLPIVTNNNSVQIVLTILLSIAILTPRDKGFFDFLEERGRYAATIVCTLYVPDVIHWVLVGVRNGDDCILPPLPLTMSRSSEYVFRPVASNVDALKYFRLEKIKTEEI